MIGVSGLNVVQGLPGFFFTIAMPAVLRERGVGLDVVSISYIVWLPLALKWLWAPAFDLYPSLRLWTLRLAPMAIGIVFAFLAIFRMDGDVLPIIVLALVSSAIGASLHVAVSTEVILRFEGTARAKANAIQVGSLTFGAFLGSSALLWLGQHFGWTATILLSAGFVVLTGLTGFLLRPTSSFAAPAAACQVSFFLPNKRVYVLMTCAVIAALSDGFIGVWLIDNGENALDVALALGSVGMLMMIPAAALAARMVKLMGCTQTLFMLMAAKATLLFGAAALPYHSVSGFTLAVLIFGLSGAILTAFWQLYMDETNSGSAASGFAFITSVEAGLLMLGGIAVGQLGEATDVRAILLCAMAGCLAASLLSLRIVPKISRQLN